MSDPVSEARKACGCLFIAVDESIARDVQLKVDVAIDSLVKEIAMLKQSRGVLIDREQDSRMECNRLWAKCAELRDALERLVIHFNEFRNDWRKGDFNLPRLAELDMESVEAQIPKAQHALSGDCGKMWKSHGEVAVLEAKCAEMQEALSRVKYGFDNCSLWKWKAEVTTYPNSPKWLFHEIVESIELALSTDCGKGWKSPEEFASLQKDLENVRQESKQWKECYLAEKEKLQNITGKP